MGHADLRIRERTMPAVADRAYELLRDRARLAAFVQAVLKEQHAEAAERAAVDLEDRDAPARLVVTRDGQPVTCLGSGMVTHAPVIPWPLTDAYLCAQASQLRTKMALSRAEDEDGADTLARVYSHPHRLTRAEFDTLTVLAPLLVQSTHEGILASRKMQRLLFRAGPLDVAQPRDREVAEPAFRVVKSTAVLLLASRDEPLGEHNAFAALACEDATLARTGWWLLMSRPTRSLDLFRRLAQMLEPAFMLEFVARGIFGLAVRYPWLREEAFDTLVPIWPRADLVSDDRPAFRARCAVASRQVRVELLGLVHSIFAASRMGIPGTPVSTETLVRVRGRMAGGETEDLVTAASWLGPAHEQIARRWNPLAGMEAEPRRHLLPPDRVAPADLARADLWRTSHQWHLTPLSSFRDMLAVALSLAPPEALAPDDRFRTRYKLAEQVQFFVSGEIDVMRRKRMEQQGAAGRPAGGAVATGAEKPGPNAPCTCGSGKKYKRCCGAA